MTGYTTHTETLNEDEMSTENSTARTVEQIHDDEYEEHVLIEVRTNRGGVIITREDGMGFWVLSKHGVTPKVGDVARYYGRGFGYSVRGLAINGRVLYYMTEAEQREEHQRQGEESDRKKREDFERNRAAFDARYSALPDVFKRRLDRFRAGNPDFRWEYEEYEMFTCEEAIKIAGVLKTPKAVERYGKAKYETQRRMVPNLSSDHSGNTHGAAVMLAYWLLKEPETVTIAHGALVPLVGCEDYGCTHPAATTPAQEQPGARKEVNDA